MKKGIVGLLVLVLISGLISAQVEGMKVIVIKMDDQTVSGDLLEVKNDSIVLMPGRLANVVVPVEEIKYLMYEKNSKNNIFGKVLAGMAIGAGIFAVTFQTVNPDFLWHGALYYGLPIGALLVLGTKKKRSNLKKMWFYGKTLDEKRNRLFSLKRFGLIKN